MAEEWTASARKAHFLNRNRHKNCLPVVKGMYIYLRSAAASLMTAYVAGAFNKAPIFDMQTEIRKFGTEREEALLKLLSLPDKKLKIIHIAGTNGKGSTAQFISEILLAAGKKVGTFTSPQAFSYEEQFKVNCVPLKCERLKKYEKFVETVSKQIEDSPSPFELQTAVAAYAFVAEGCEYAVMECGLGGRDDATNGVSSKLMAVITSISIEHVKELGGTIEEICRAKSGIIKNCPVIISASQSEGVKEFFLEFSPIVAGEDIKIFPRFPYGSHFVYKGEEYEIALNGGEQCYNAATAIEAARLLNIEEEFIKQGLKNARLPGRVQPVFSKDRLFILDGSHNPASFAPFIEGVKSIQGEKQLVFGCLSDKDVFAAAKLLSPHFKDIFVFSPNSPRAMDTDKIRSAFLSAGGNALAAESASDALERTTAQTVGVCGSFTILKEAAEWIEKRR